MRTRIAFVLLMLPPSTLLIAQQNPEVQTSFRPFAAPTTIQGYRCATGAAWFYEGGRLRTCSVAISTAFGEAVVPAGSTIYLLPEGTPSYVFLSRNTEIHGYTCRGVKHDLMTSFYPNGRLRVCWLAADQEIQSVPCMQTTFMGKMFRGVSEATLFYDNGQLKSCRVSQDVTVQGEKFKRGEHVFFDRHRKLVNAT